MKRGSCRILLILSLYLIVCGQVWRDKVSRENSEGNARYQQKAYDEALEKYVEAQDFSRPRPEISYNIANTLYQQKKYPESLKEYEKSIAAAKPGLGQRIIFNRGNSLYQMGQYQAAAESYQQALKLDPKDRDAKHNLELALKKLEDNRQQQKSKESEMDTKNGKGSPQDDQGKSNSDRNQKKPEDQSSPKAGNGNGSKPQTESKQSQTNQTQGRRESREMDSREALRLLDAINEQEKKEQRKQILKLQQSQPSGRDW